MLLASKQHTESDKRRWTVRYGRWLDNTATIDTINVTSSSDTCTVDTPATILGQDVVFFLNGGVLGETFTVTLVMVDSFLNKKTDTISFHVVAA
jgi:hypothetical protein